MPSSTFSIATGTDDQTAYKSASVYPPTGSVARYTTVGTLYVGRNKAGATYEVDAGLLKFDTSSLPDNAEPTSAVLRVVPTFVANTDSLSFVAEWYVWNGTDSDYTATSSNTAHAGTALSGITQNSSRDFTLQNLSGNISVTSYTYLRLHVTQRTSDAAPTGNNACNIAALEDVTYAEPQLVVTYATGGGDLIGQVAI